MALPILAMLAWAACTETGLIEHRAIAGPVATAGALADGIASGGLLLDLGATAARIAGGVLLGLLWGLPIGLASGVLKSEGSPRAAGLEPSLDFLRAIPPLLIFPLLLLAFGYGERARVGVIGWAAALVISMHVASGLGRASSQRLRALRAMGASRWQTFRWLYFYETLPAGVTALRHAFSTAGVVAVVTEMVIGVPHGLGARAVAAQIAYETADLYAVICLTGGAGYLVSRTLLALEPHLIRWR